MPAMDDLDLQDDWNAQPLRDHWALTPDLRFAFERFAELTVAATADGAAGGIVEVAAAEGVHACSLSERGLSTYILEPSPTMLAAARARQRRSGLQIPLVRGVAEALPFRDGALDRVLCDSALDHLADPERGIREMARITAPDGRVVLTFVNYGGFTVRASRFLYRLGRRLGLVPPLRDRHLFWDSPVPYEHSFECTLENVSAMCQPYLQLEHARGVSLGCKFPGWSRALERLPALRGVLPLLDRLVTRQPGVADHVVSVWRPKPRSQWPEAEEQRVRATNPVFQRLLADEERYWASADSNAFFARAIEATRELSNRLLTGRPDRDWLDDLIARGPFERAALLGYDPGLERRWLHALPGASELDVYELSPAVIARARSRDGDLGSRVRFRRADLNFVRLPEAAYDAIWTSDTLHCITNLEYLLTQIERALRPGGLFALRGYVGEARMQFDPQRLARMNAVLASLPARFRLTDAVRPPEPSLQLSPFTAARAPDVLPLVRGRFDVVFEALGGRLFPLPLTIEWDAVAREGALPDVLARLAGAEAEAADDPAMRPCVAYGVYRARGAVTPARRRSAPA
jgi:ubiquinone/menaquinone biosynthesis C-methylase UbiE